MAGASRTRVPFRYKAAGIVASLALLSLIHPAKQLIAHERAALARSWSLPLPEAVEGMRGALPSAGGDVALRVGRASQRRLQQAAPSVSQAEGSESVPDDADDELCSAAIAELPPEARCQHVQVGRCPLVQE